MLRLNAGKNLSTGIFAVALVLVGSLAQADPLDDAKSGGLVGETSLGLIAAVEASPSANIKALVRDINARRLARYGEIAASTGGSLEQVQALVGRRLIDGAPSGSFVLGADGAWVRVP